MRAQGFDTSRHNHPGDLPIDFQIAYDAGYSFWAGRLSVGNYYIDSWIERDYAAASSTPIRKVVYHVPRAYLDTASQVAKLREGLVLLPTQPAGIVLDVETDKELGKRAVTICLGEHIQAILAFWSRRLILYTNFEYLNNYIDLNLLASYLPQGFQLDLWIAWPAAGGAYNPNPDPPIVSWVIYQRSWTHMIPGHPDQTVDLDEFNGDETQMQVYFGQEEIPDMATILENAQQAHALLQQLRTQVLTTYQALNPLLAEIELQAADCGNTPPPPPAEDPYVIIAITRDPRANAFFEHSQNAAGRPIMMIYPSESAPTQERIQFDQGEQLHADPGKVTADGGGKFWRLQQQHGRAGETLYIRELDAVLA